MMPKKNTPGQVTVQFENNQKSAQWLSQPGLLPAILNRSSEGILVCDANKQLQFANETARSMLGFPSGETYPDPKSWRRIISENGKPGAGNIADSTANLGRILERALAGETIHGQAVKISGQGGSHSDLQVSASPLHGTDQTILGAVAYLKSLHEDSEASQSEDADGAKRDAALDAFFEASPALLNLFDRNLRFIKTDPYTPTYFGLDSQSIIGKSVWQLNPPVAEQYLGPILDKVIRTGQPELNVELSGPIPSKPGEIGFFRASYFPVPLPGGEIGFGSMAVDITDIKRVEEAARQTQETLADFLESTHDSFFALDRNWRFIYINRRFGEYIHRAPEELIGKNIWEALPELSGSPIAAYYYRVMNERTPAHFQAGGIYTQYWFDVSIYPTRDGISIFTTDKTEEHQAELALAESESRFRDLADAMPQLVWSARQDGAVDYYNQRYREYTGITPGTGEAWEWGPVLHPDDRQRTIEAWEQAVRNGTMYQVEHRAKMADGSFRWHLSRGVPMRDQHGQIARWFGTATDIEDLKQTEAALQDRTARMVLLSDAARDLLISDDPSALLETLYHRLASLLGLEIYIHYELSEDGSRLQIVSSCGFSDEARQELDHMTLGETVCGTVAETREPWIISNVQASTDPHTAIIRAQGLTVYACHPLIVNDRLMGTLSFGSRSRDHFTPESVGLLRAISDLLAIAIDRKQSELALHEYSARLERSNRELQDFAYIASHDLQEPLRKVSAFGDMLYQKLQGKLDGAEKEQFERMLNSARRMQRMINDLLDLSRVTTQGKPFQVVDLNRLADEAVSDLEMPIAKANGKVEIGDLPSIEADPIQIGRLLMNLIGNGIKYHREDIPPVIRVSGQKTLVKGQEMAEIRVEDNGIGFDMQYAERIFQPFQRLHGRSQYEGTGIGLAICKKIVERHGGSIGVTSQPGQGSTFIVALPLRHT